MENQYAVQRKSMMRQVVPCCWDVEQQRLRSWRQHERVGIYEIVALEELSCMSFELDIWFLLPSTWLHVVAHTVSLGLCLYLGEIWTCRSSCGFQQVFVKKTCDSSCYSWNEAQTKKGSFFTLIWKPSQIHGLGEWHQACSSFLFVVCMWPGPGLESW